MILQQLMEVRSLSEENKTHKRVPISGPRSKFWMNWLFSVVSEGRSLDKLVVSDGVLPDATVNLL